MTGFGRGQSSVGGYCVTVEIRSVNSKFIEVSSRIPHALSSLEQHVTEVVQERLGRGKVSVNVSLDNSTGNGAFTVREVIPNLPLAEAYKKAVETVRDHLGMAAEVDLAALVRMDGVLAVRDTQLESETAALLLDGALDAAIEELQAMRCKEGEALAKDFLFRIDRLRELVSLVEARAPERVEEARRKLTERISALLGSNSVDPQRIAMEVAILSDRADITEECVRFRSHLDQFVNLMREDASGRKLNFLLQEMGREVNTTGSKSNDATIAHLVVEMKEEIERLREQVQNIE
ncbi:MAG TPA: YicC family protein [Candidatus Latescibacteria bacterium]|nr:YicC family protein [Candidatus Latescibacterota bacterium]